MVFKNKEKEIKDLDLPDLARKLESGFGSMTEKEKKSADREATSILAENYFNEEDFNTDKVVKLAESLSKEDKKDNKLRVKILEKALDRVISEGMPMNARNVATALERKLTDEELEKMFRLSMVNKNVMSAKNAAELMDPSEKRTKFLEETLSLAISEGMPMNARNVATALGRKLTDEELRSIFSSAIEENRLSTAKSAAELMTAGEEKTKLLEEVLAIFVSEGMPINAESVVKLLGRELTSDEKNRLATAAK